MLCDKCKKNTATIRFQQIFNGKQMTLNLCGECAAQGAYAVPIELSGMNLNDFIASVFNLGKMGESNAALSCPTCGYTLDRFNETSLLGCDDCYNTFRRDLLPIIKNIHGSVNYVPDAAAPSIQKEDEIARLRAQLYEAVKNEKYEEAVPLRDKIKELEAKKDEGVKDQ